MDQTVSLQVVSSGKDLVAHITCVLTSVDSHVSFQITGHGESLTAHITRKGRKTSMDPAVSLQVIGPGKDLTAHSTDMSTVPACTCIRFIVFHTTATSITTTSEGVWVHSWQPFPMR